MSHRQDTTVDADVLIVGGGMAGCALAHALSNNHRVLVLEKQPETFEQNLIGESLPAVAVHSLAALGLAHTLENASHQAYHGVVSIWGQSAPIRKDFFETLDGVGLHIDRGSLNRAITQAAIAAGVRVKYDCQLKSLARINDGWTAQLNDCGKSASLNVRFVVDASGRTNVVARKLGLKRVNADRAVAIHAHRSSAQSAIDTGQRGYQGTTLIEAVEQGWWYRAPLPNGEHVVSFHTDSDLDAAHDMQKPEHWLESFESTKLVSMGVDAGVTNDLHLSVCAANSSFAQRCAGNGWLAIGDAALAFDPISSQGMFNALTTAALARDSIHECLNGNADSVDLYAQQMANVRAAYQRNLTAFYQVEARWLGSPFWDRRCA